MSDRVTPPTPIALTIAGSDSGGGAGIQADLKAFSALGVYGASAITALTAQNTREVAAIHDVPAKFVSEQLRCVLGDLNVNAIKIGMLSTVPVIEAVRDVLEEWPDVPVVLDPVMVAKSGDRLLQPEALDALFGMLCPLAHLITPNVPEAALLTGMPEVVDEAGLVAQARALSLVNRGAVLLKGGHLAGAQSTDVLLDADGELHHFRWPRVDTRNTHGTGCTLSAAIAAGIARGLPLVQAVTEAERYVHDAITTADRLSIGTGHGPVNHFHASWPVVDGLGG